MRDYTITDTSSKSYKIGQAIVLHLEDAAGIKRVVAIPYYAADEKDAREGKRVWRRICTFAGIAGAMDTSEVHGAKIPAKITEHRFSTGGVGCRRIHAAEDHQ